MEHGQRAGGAGKSSPTREHLDAVDALRRPLELAHRGGKIPGLAIALRLGAERLSAFESDAALSLWRSGLAGFEELDSPQQGAVVAEGLALVRRLTPVAAAATGEARAAVVGAGARGLPSRAVHAPVPTRTPAAMTRPSAGVARGAPMDPAAGAPGSFASPAEVAPRSPRPAGAVLERSSSPRRPSTSSARVARAAAASPSTQVELGLGGADREASRGAPGVGPRRGAPGAAPGVGVTSRASPGRAPSAGRGSTAGPSGPSAGPSATAAPSGPVAATAAPVAAAMQVAADRPAAAASTAAAAVQIAADRPAAASTAAAGAPATADRPGRRSAGARATELVDGAPSPRRARAAGRGAPPKDEDPLAAPTHTLRGIGPAFAARLAERGLGTVEDLLWLLPRRYDDLRAVPSLGAVVARGADAARSSKDAPPAQVCLLAVVRSVRMVFARGRRWAEARLGCPDATEAGPTLLVRWFGLRAGLEQRVPLGSRVVLVGGLRVAGAGRAEMANPDIVEVVAPGAAPTPRIAVHYPLVRGVPPGRLRAACASACERVAGLVEDGVPPAVERAAGMPCLADTLTALHSPTPSLAPAALEALGAGTSSWHRRLAFGELFALAAAVAARRAQRRGDRAVVCPPVDAAGELAAVLPFALTSAQRRAIAELGADLAGDSPMCRLLEGDVGAGKTLVALAAAVQAVRAGAQVALMAPTAVLAEQHAQSWRGLAEDLRLRLGLLTAATPRAEAAALTAALGRGELDIVVGTHALLSEGVRFHRLALCVVDEQHRFGVAQRVALRAKGPAGACPHLLVMTATPIPRTLALTAYGDLELSILDQLPPGRQPPRTRVLRGARGEAEAVRTIAARIAAGQRAFVVCPKIGPAADDDDDEPWRDAISVARELGGALSGVGLVHGKLDPATRDATMRDFRDGRLSVLVATTVIEVGVDVPQATVMAIFDADRFGLSQLHQLRGRVGRGGGASDCLLLVRGATTEEGARRLEVMTETSDGFRIAEEDLRLRGPGEVLGARQAGAPRLRFGDLAEHTKLLLEARAAAESVLAADPRLARPEHAALRRALRRRLDEQEIFGAESG